MLKNILAALAILLEATVLIAYYEQAPPRKLTPPAPQTAEQQRLQKQEYDQIQKQKSAQPRGATGDGLFPQPPAPPPASGVATTTAPQTAPKKK
jgi:hypothetical protein